jgi:hypothetical protein
VRLHLHDFEEFTRKNLVQFASLFQSMTLVDVDHPGILDGIGLVLGTVKTVDGHEPQRQFFEASIVIEHDGKHTLTLYNRSLDPIKGAGDETKRLRPGHKLPVL